MAGNEKDSGYKLVVAFDIGTTYSGYAYSYTKSPTDVVVPSDWGYCVGNASVIKTPTIVITDMSLNFKAMGYDAVEELGNTDDFAEQRYRVFEGFKMILYTENNITLSTQIEDHRGDSCDAIDIFAMLLKELKRKLQESFKSRRESLPDNKYIRWVVTVPAIWSESAKQFMREVACKAEIVDKATDKNLILALEPEAASLYCRTLPPEEFGSELSYENSRLSRGVRYLVMDVGGGTLDVTVHEVLANGKLAELHIANGGAMGADQVNKEFHQLFDAIFKSGYLDVCQWEHPGTYMNFEYSFETIKKTIGLKFRDKFNIGLHTDFTKLFHDMYAQPLEDSVQQKYRDQGVKMIKGNLQLPINVLSQIFLPLVAEIVNYLDVLLKRPELAKVSKILMVGGFSDCSFLKDEMSKKFGGKYALVIPKETCCAVLKGAVLFGHDPTIIWSRRAKMTYGISISETFDAAKHDPGKTEVVDGKKYAKNWFDIWVKRGEVVEVDSSKSKKYIPQQADATSISYQIFATSDDSVRYTDEEMIEKLGNMIIELPGKGSDREMKCSMKFGGTEIEVEARDVRKGGKTVKTSVDFLTGR